jgi:hypothetical protein
MTGPQANLTPEAAYQQAQGTFGGIQARLAASNAILNASGADKDSAAYKAALADQIEALKLLPDASTKLLDASKNYNASGAGYQSDLAMVLEALRIAGGIGGDGSISMMEQQLIELQKIRDAVTTGDLVIALGRTGILATLLGAFNAETARKLQMEKEDAAAQTRVKITAAQKLVDDNQVIINKKPQAEVDKVVNTYMAGSKLAVASTYQGWLDTANAQIAWYENTRNTSTADANEYTQNKLNVEFYQREINKYTAEAAVYTGLAKTAQDTIDAANLATANMPGLIAQVTTLTDMLNRIIATYIIPPVVTVTPSASFAVGTSYVSNDMLANIHQGEIVMDRQSADVLRRYGIPTSGSADNKEVVAELKESNKQLTASVRVLQAGFNRLIAINEKQSESMNGIETKTKIQASA